VAQRSFDSLDWTERTRSTDVGVGVGVGRSACAYV
jgi:hypothetical protein